jgi:hypothetical protein
MECEENCRQLTWANGALTYDVDGSRLAYVGADNFVGVLDLDTAEELKIPVPENERLPGSRRAVGVEDSTVVFSTYSVEGGWHGWLWRYDLATQCRRRLQEFANPELTYVGTPLDVDMDGTWIVWNDSRWGTRTVDIFSYDLSSDTEVRLTFDECCVGGTRLSGTGVVYQGWADGPRGIHLVDVFGGDATRIWEDQREQSQPANDGSRVVFMYQVEWRPVPNTDIHGVDVATGEDFVVTEEASLQHYPDIDGDLVVWEDERNSSRPHEYGRDNTDIYGKNLTTGEEFQVTSLPGLEVRPRIVDRTVYYQAAATDSGEIFAVDLPL